MSLMAPRKGKSKYEFEVRWTSGKYYSCDIIDENKYFAPGSNYDIEGTERNGTRWHANVPIENLRLVGSAAKHVDLLDALNATIGERKAAEAEKIQQAQEAEKRKREKETAEKRRQAKLIEEKARLEKYRKLEAAKKEKQRQREIEKREREKRRQLEKKRKDKKRTEERKKKEEARKREMEKKRKIKEQRMKKQLEMKEKKKIKEMQRKQRQRDKLELEEKRRDTRSRLLQETKVYESTAYVRDPDELENILITLKEFFTLSQSNNDFNATNSSSTTHVHTSALKLKKLQETEYEIRRVLLDMTLKDRENIDNIAYIRKFNLEDAILLQECILTQQINRSTEPLLTCAMCGEEDGGYYKNDEIYPDSRVQCNGCGNSYHTVCANRFDLRYKYTKHYFCPLCKACKSLQQHVITGNMERVVSLLKSRYVSPFHCLLKNGKISKPEIAEDRMPNALMLASERGNLEMLQVLLSPFICTCGLARKSSLWPQQNEALTSAQ